MRFLRAVFIPFVLGIGSAAAQPIVIGQTAAFSGGPSASVIEITAGARLIIDDVNSRGGVRGRKIQLVSMDDGYESSRAVANTAALALEHKAVALLLSRGTEPTEAMLPQLTKFGLPLIGPSTGAMSLIRPVHPYVFNVRSSYQGEARKSVSQLVSMGFNRIGIVYVDDSFGRDSIKGVLEGFQDAAVTPDFVEKFDRGEKDFSKIVKRAADLQPRALMLIGTNAPIISLLSGFKEAGVRSYVATLSNNASEGFLKAANGKATVIIVSQVFPSERAQHIPIVRELTELSKKASEGVQPASSASDALSMVDKFLARGQPPSPAMIEGAVAAKVLIAGLRRTKGEISSENLVTALNAGGPIEVGWPGKEIRYSEANHAGIEHIDLSVISDGKFRR